MALDLHLRYICCDHDTTMKTMCCIENWCAIAQVGGSDQWGNITAGTDLVRRLLGGSRDSAGVDGSDQQQQGDSSAPACYGLTFPLLVRDGNGTKGAGCMTLKWYTSPPEVVTFTDARTPSTTCTHINTQSCMLVTSNVMPS